MSTRRRGMDHPHYDYSAIAQRPPLAWPGGARIAWYVMLHLEHWELDPPADALSDPRYGDHYGRFFPDYRTYTWRQYGNRVGIFRILELLDRLGLAVTLAVNAASCVEYPYLVAQCRRRGYDVLAHGSHASRMISSRLSEAQERRVIAESIDAVEAAFGTRPTGWTSQDYGESMRTPRLLAEAGLTHVVDWPNDDQPYRMTVGRDFVSIPSQAEWDDVQLLWHRRIPAPRFPALVDEAFAQLHAEGGRVFGLNIHPWVAGKPHVFAHLEAALERLCAYGQAWQATTPAIARHVLEAR